MKRLWLFILLITLNACSGEALWEVAEGGIGGSGVTIGPISGFGSIYVNGVVYDTDNAHILINGEVSDSTALRVGMIVTIEGNLSADGTQGVAHNIHFADDLRGPLSAIDLEQGILHVLGQSVYVDQRTILEGVTTLAEIPVARFVAISALSVSDGTWRATRVRAYAPDKGVRIRGRVMAHDASAYTFRIGALLVDYRAAGIIADMPKNGVWLALEGYLHEQVLYAQRIIEAAPAPARPGELLLLRGHVTGVNGATALEIDFRTARFDDATRFSFGSAADLHAGAEVTVRAQTDNNGVLVLRHVEFNNATAARSDISQIALSAPLESVDAAQRQIALDGLNLNIPLGAIIDDANNAHARLGLAQLRPGEYLTVYGFIDLASGAFIVERLQRQAR
jgi:hypothetical protein